MNSKDAFHHTADSSAIWLYVKPRAGYGTPHGYDAELWIGSLRVDAEVQAGLFDEILFRTCDGFEYSAERKGALSDNRHFPVSFVGVAKPRLRSYVVHFSEENGIPTGSMTLGPPMSQFTEVPTRAESRPVTLDVQGISRVDKLEQQPGEPLPWLPLGAGVLCWLALLPDLAYSYFVFLRFAVFVAAVYCSIIEFSKKRKWRGRFFGGVAVLFNPIIKVHLDRDLWVIVDFIVGVTFFWFVIRSRLPDATVLKNLFRKTLEVTKAALWALGVITMLVIMISMAAGLGPWSDEAIATRKAEKEERERERWYRIIPPSFHGDSASEQLRRILDFPDEERNGNQGQ